MPWKECRKRAPEDGYDRSTGSEQFFRDATLSVTIFAFWGQLAEAVAAADAPVEDDVGIALVDLDGLNRAASDTGVTFAAFLLKGVIGPIYPLDEIIAGMPDIRQSGCAIPGTGYTGVRRNWHNTPCFDATGFTSYRPLPLHGLD